MLCSRGKGLAETDRKGMNDLASMNRDNFELFSTKPLAMIESGTYFSRHATKSNTTKRPKMLYRTLLLLGKM